MNVMLRSSMILCLISCIGCSGDPQPVVESPNAPYPYTAREIHEAHKLGLTKRYRAAGEDGVDSYSELTVIDRDKNGVKFRRKLFTATGETKGDPVELTSTWGQLRDHATYPREATTIRETTKRTRAGSFDCYEYIVVRGDMRMVIYFAKDLPGAPIQMTTTMAGKKIHEMELVELSGN